MRMRLPPAPEITWTAEGAPRAALFDDVYFSRAGGLAETEAVYLAGCGLPDRWRGRARFSICELGFGAGLNALAVWRMWRHTRSAHAVLHMCSIEAYPLAHADAARALSAFPEIGELAAALLECWPVRAYAPQRLWFPEDGFALTLCIGEAHAALAEMSGAFDAFFLDGFSPARNPHMWSPQIMHQVARLSASDARVASFSVAGDVRRHLGAVGFEVEKKPGFGAKRERLEARRVSSVEASTTITTKDGARYPYVASAHARVAIIGAGVAGAACAQALTRRGVETIVLDAATALGAGASGNPAGLVTPRLNRGGVLREVFLAAYLEAVAAYTRLGVFTSCGVAEYAAPRGAAALADLLADPPLPEDWFAPLEGGALHARAGLIAPLPALEAMLAGAQLMLDAQVGAIERAGAAWRILGPDGRAVLKADALVLACGPALKAFAPASFLPIEISRGQVEWGPLRGVPPAHAMTRGSYAAPFADGVLFGATFDPAEAGATVEADDASRARNLAALKRLAPELAAQVETQRLKSRAAFRAATPDRAPIAGMLPDAEAWLAQYAALARGAKPAPHLAPPAHHGVYVLGGLGARGFTLAPLLGERIASEICGEPQALSISALAALHPARFLRRALKKSG